MRKQQHRVRCSIGMLLVLATFTVAGPVDPCRPAEREARRALAEEPVARWPPTRIRQLESERDQLMVKVSALPQHSPKPLLDHLGYHSCLKLPTPAVRPHRTK